MDHQMEAWKDALKSIASMIDRSEKAQVKFAPGTSQHTLLKNRIRALHIAAALIRQAHHAGCGDMDAYTREDMERASAPIASLISKSEKAQSKLSPGTWQHAMLENNLLALRMASALLTKALD